jgi:hypothetical protein
VVFPQVFEVEYLERISQPRTFRIRLSLWYPEFSNPDATVEIQGYTAELATPIPVGTPGPLPQAMGLDYQLFLAARVDAPGFDIQPSSEQEYSVADDAELTWIWLLSADDTTAGEKLINVSVVARWRPFPPSQAPTFEYLVYHTPDHCQCPTAPPEWTYRGFACRLLGSNAHTRRNSRLGGNDVGEEVISWRIQAT